MIWRETIAAILSAFLVTSAVAVDPAAYLGDWSNGRGETLAITASTIQFGNDKPVPYRDVTRATDGSAFELQLTGAGKINAFVGKTLSLKLAGDSMELTSYVSHGDYMEEKNPRQVVTWSRDAPRDAKEESDIKATPTATPHAPYTPKPGSAERKAIALALHVPFERDLQQSVILKFDQLQVMHDWALARVRPYQRNERKIDYRRTKYKERIAEGMFDELGEALLKREHGRWTVLEWSFGNTDTTMAEWIKAHRAPKALIE